MVQGHYKENATISHWHYNFNFVCTWRVYIDDFVLTRSLDLILLNVICLVLSPVILKVVEVS